MVISFWSPNHSFIEHPPLLFPKIFTHLKSNFGCFQILKWLFQIIDRVSHQAVLEIWKAAYYLDIQYLIYLCCRVMSKW